MCKAAFAAVHGQSRLAGNAWCCERVSGLHFFIRFPEESVLRLSYLFIDPSKLGGNKTVTKYSVD